jgi:hypothetical protein
MNRQGTADPVRTLASSRKVTPTWSHSGGELVHEQAGEADRVFRADCKAKRANSRSKYFFIVADRTCSTQRAYSGSSAAYELS